MPQSYKLLVCGLITSSENHRSGLVTSSENHYSGLVTSSEKMRSIFLYREVYRELYREPPRTPHKPSLPNNAPHKTQSIALKNPLALLLHRQMLLAKL